MSDQCYLQQHKFKSSEMCVFIYYARRQQHITSQLQRREKMSETKIYNTHPFNGPFSRTTQVSRYQKGKNQSGIY